MSAKGGERAFIVGLRTQSRIIPFSLLEEPMKRITATFSVTDAQDSVAPVAPHEAYLTVAVGLMRGANVLAAAPLSESAMALALLSGQILECSLKAFLSKAGRTERELRRKDVRHNLLELWALAVREGLCITATPPQWAETLNRLHDYPYHLRYPMGLHGLVLPNPQQTTSELEHLIDTVRQKNR
jgi:hypothetical protein